MALRERGVRTGVSLTGPHCPNSRDDDCVPSCSSVALGIGGRRLMTEFAAADA